jgi:hypothetical protein
MKSLANNSSNCTFNSFNSAGAIRYGAFEIGVVPGNNSIPNSTSLPGGNPEISSGNTSTNYDTTGIVEMSGVFEEVETIIARYAAHSDVIKCFASKAEICNI